MPDYINWYVVELGRRLAPHFSSIRVAEILKETESHLREASTRYQAKFGLSEERANQAAIEAFGKLDKVSQTYLQESDPRLFGVRPIWVVLLCALIAIGCWNFHWMTLSGYYDNFGDTWQNGLAGIIGFSALTVFVLACRKGLRSYSMHILVLGIGAALCSIFLTSFWLISAEPGWQGVSRLHMKRDTERIEESLHKLGLLESYFVQGQTEFASAKTLADVSDEYTDLNKMNTRLQSSLKSVGMHYENGKLLSNQAVIPRSSVLAFVDGRIFALSSAPTFEEAKIAWQSKTPTAIQSIREERKRLGQLLTYVGQAQSGRLFFFNPGVYRDSVILTLMFTAALLLLDALVFTWVRCRRAWTGVVVA